MSKKTGAMGMDLLKTMRLAVIDRIEAEMERRSWKPVDLARACNVKPEFIYKKLTKEGDFRGISVDDIELFANAFKIDPGDLFPKKFTDDIFEALKTLPFIDLMRIICQKEIKKYFNNKS